MFLFISVEEPSLSSAFEVAKKKACDDFEEKSWHQGKKFASYLDKLEDECEAQFKKNKDENFSASQVQCEKILQEVLRGVEKQTGTRYSTPSGVGLKNFEEDLGNMHSEYKERAIGPARESVWQKAEDTEVK